MLSFEFRDLSALNNYYIDWHFDKPVPKGNAVNIQSVKADGQELDYLRNTFSGIPFHKTARVQVWRGDLAKFIYDNLK